jgi:hypothetical protein
MRKNRYIVRGVKVGSRWCWQVFHRTTGMRFSQEYLNIRSAWMIAAAREGQP